MNWLLLACSAQVSVDVRLKVSTKLIAIDNTPQIALDMPIDCLPTEQAVVPTEVMEALIVAASPLGVS